MAVLIDFGLMRRGLRGDGEARVNGEMNLGVTPDGQRGPRHHFQKGAI